MRHARTQLLLHWPKCLAQWVLVVVVALPRLATAQLATTYHAANVPADVAFMQGMIAHHAQALAMVSLIPARTTLAAMCSIGDRIRISQHDEIAMMQRWLRAHHEAVPTVDDHYVAHMFNGDLVGMQMPDTMRLMPGMLTDAQIAQLARTTGPEFDRLFLEGMIRHHEGALAMVATLFAAPGAGQRSDIFRFANDVDADQRAEISRMQGMLAQSPSGAHH